MNTRITLAAALAATALFALAPAQAQAPGAGGSIETSRLETKIAIMQQQINALQSQVQQLQAQLRAASPAPVTGPNNRMPSFTVPKFNVPNVTVPNLAVPNITLPNNPQTFIVPHTQSRNGSIPDYTATFISRTAR